VLTIRLARIRARKQPYYRIVVIEKARARNGRPVEVVGTYNPRTSPASVELKPSCTSSKPAFTDMPCRKFWEMPARPSRRTNIIWLWGFIDGPAEPGLAAKGAKLMPWVASAHS
jgi:small subunit ribosomal protein S16